MRKLLGENQWEAETMDYFTQPVVSQKMTGENLVNFKVNTTTNRWLIDNHINQKAVKRICVLVSNRNSRPLTKLDQGYHGL